MVELNKKSKQSQKTIKYKIKTIKLTTLVAKTLCYLENE